MVDVIIVGGGLAGLSAAIYLARARRDVLIVDTGKSMARWEPHVENYLGFPAGVAGGELLRRGRIQVRRYPVKFLHDEIVAARRKGGSFTLRGRDASYRGRRVLLATGIYHIPPAIRGLKQCLGHSLFFCKDCDGYRVQGRRIAIYGWSNEAIKYALGMRLYTSRVAILTDGHPPRWDKRHVRWMREYNIPVHSQKIVAIERRGKQLQAICLDDGSRVETDAMFTTRGDIYFNKLARDLGAAIDAEGEIVVDLDMRTTVRGLYAAGCVTPANCQMIIAAGQGATAAQAINDDLFKESLATHSLCRSRGGDLRRRKTDPAASEPRLARAALKAYRPREPRSRRLVR